MNKHVFAAVLLSFGFLVPFAAPNAAEQAVPEPFQGFDDSSKYAINYDDLTNLLKAVVVDTGRSTRRVPQPADDVTGTRMKTKVKMTAREGNRFYFETFKDDEASREYLLNIQKSLEQLPSEAPLKYFSRDEQLAYWLNLYNVTVLNQIIDLYPKRNLKKYVQGKRSIFSEKLLNVAGVPLSLDDIQHVILRQNYDNNPLIMYGLYQGIIGGPNIRRTAYTGANVYNALQDNAEEFINSNRGTFSRDSKTFRVSSFYERNKGYFPNFNNDLPTHLLAHLEGDEREKLQSSSKLKTDIDDWTITDLGGSHARIGGSFATSRAALMDSVRSTVPGDPAAGGGTVAAMSGHASSSMVAKGRRLSRIEPELLEMLHEINEKRIAEMERGATVTIEDLEDAPAESEPDTTEDQ